jgi:hypothetical protein
MQADHGRVLYEGHSERTGSQILVTTQWCVASGVSYPISELGLLGTSRGRRDVLRAGKLAGLLALAAAVLLFVLAVRRGWTSQVWIAAAVTAVATVVVTAMPAVLGWIFRRPYEIWAHYRGSPVLLFATEDSEQYGQVARALVRARETHA